MPAVSWAGGTETGERVIDIHGRAIRVRIDRWTDAGLIDEATAGRLLAFESSRRATGVPVATAIGAISVALGVIALVSANWEALPVWTKLGGHVALNLGIGVWLWSGMARERLGFAARETLLLVLSASTLALLAHVGQSFQLQGGAFGLMLAWLLLATPFTLAFARGAINRWAWTAGLFTAFAAGMEEHGEQLADAGLVSTAIALFLLAGFAAPLATRGRGGVEVWGRHLNTVMLAALVLLTSATQVLWRFDGDPDNTLPIMGDVLPGTLLAMAGFLAAHVAFERGRPQRVWLVAFVVASPLWAALPLVAGGADSAVVAGAAFCLYWAAIAQLAHANGRTGIYRLAVTVIALRILVVFVEAFGGLLLTGVGLVATGLLLLGFGYLVRRVLKRTAQGAPS